MSFGLIVWRHKIIIMITALTMRKLGDDADNDNAATAVNDEND